MSTKARWSVSILCNNIEQIFDNCINQLMNESIINESRPIDFYCFLQRALLACDAGVVGTCDARVCTNFV